MAELSTRKKSARIRLLITCCVFFKFMVYAQDKIPPQIQIQNEILFLNSFFSVEIKLDNNSAYAGSLVNFPQLLIEDESLELVESGASKLYDGILIKNKYRLKKTGKFTLAPKLVIGKKVTALKTFSIHIEPPELSQSTNFKWEIFSLNNELSPEIIIGVKYKIILFGFFYLPNEKANALLHWDVNCQAPENAILELCIAEDLNSSYSNNDGWHPVACFYWTPLADKELSLPTPVLSATMYSKPIEKIFVPEEKIFVHNVINTSLNESSDDETALQTLAKTFGSDSTASLPQKTEIDFITLTEKAKQIAALRLRESEFIFPLKIKAQRIKIEKELNIENTFPVYSVLLRQISFVFVFLFIFFICFIFVLNKRKKRKHFTFLIIAFIIPALLSIVMYSYFFVTGRYKTAVYIPTDKNNPAYIYQIPELSGTPSGELKIGETVIIKKKNIPWIYVEKNDKTGGWKNISEFIVIEHL